MAENNSRINILDAQLLSRMRALTYGNDVILFDRHALRFYENRIVCFPFALLSFLDSGSADILVEGLPYHIVANDQFILLPNQSISIHNLSDDFHARFVLLSQDFVSYVTTEDSYQFIQMVRHNPLIHLPEHITNAFCCCYDLLRTTILQDNNPYQKRMLFHIIKTYIYGVMYYVQPATPQPQTREAELTYTFMELVEQHYREQHSLSFYADAMHLSAKYISKCVRLTTGQGGMQTIANRIMQQARVMLIARQKSIAQIGYELGFPDQSAFGKFFHAHEHVSPQKWRLSHT